MEDNDSGEEDDEDDEDTDDNEQQKTSQELPLESASKLPSIAVDTHKGTVASRNVHAVNIVRRVKEKLQGKITESPPLATKPGVSEPSKYKLLSVSEQVNLVIKQAVSTDNLAQMYEGWTPWI